MTTKNEILSLQANIFKIKNERKKKLTAEIKELKINYNVNNL